MSSAEHGGRALRAFRSRTLAVPLFALVLGCNAELTDPGAAGTAGAAATGNGGSAGASGTSTGGTGNGTGTGGTTGGSSGSAGAPACTDIDANETGMGVLRRLTKLEYGLTLQDLFALSAPPTLDGIPDDNARDGFRT